MWRKVRKGFALLIVNIIVVALLFFLCEGAASFILFWQTVSLSPPLAERQHTAYDELLGWVNRPNVTIEDMYGPGLELQTNGQGFRNRHTFEATVPPGQVRLICSGDSFTLGYGVGNEATWCHQLSELDERLQTVNMGQGGYGIDQAYLWYKRDAAPLDHDLHLFSFITIDFERMQQREFLGYGKPLLRVEGEEIIVDNVPVPQRAFYLPWLTHNREAIGRLTSVQVMRQLFQETDTVQAEVANKDTAAPEVVAGAILKDLLRLNRAKDSTLVLVYLPTLGDYDPAQATATERWREFLAVAAADTGVAYIDLVAALRDLPPAQVGPLFIPEGTVEFPGAAGHYSVEGNRWVAEEVYEALRELPEVTEKLKRSEAK